MATIPGRMSIPGCIPIGLVLNADFLKGADFAIFYSDFAIFYTDFVIFYTGFLLFCIRLLKPLDEARDEGLDIVTFINDDALDTEVGNVNVNV